MATQKKNPDETIHLQVKQGAVAHFDGKAFGDRATIQVRRGDRDQVTGDVTEIDPTKVPDVGSLPPAA